MIIMMIIIMIITRKAQLQRSHRLQQVGRTTAIILVWFHRRFGAPSWRGAVLAMVSPAALRLVVNDSPAPRDARSLFEQCLSISSNHSLCRYVGFAVVFEFK